MQAMRVLAGFVFAVLTGFLLSVGFLTAQTLSHYPGFAAAPAAYASTYWLNLQGLSTGSPFVIIFAAALATGFVVAALLKRVLKPLAGAAYILAGAAATPALFAIVENFVIGGGVGAFYGARGLVGMALQALAGAAAGLVFTQFAGRRLP